MPPQNEPKAIHGVPEASVMTPGSIALYSVTPGVERHTSPWSVQPKSAASTSRVGLVARPIDEVFFPNRETEY